MKHRTICIVAMLCLACLTLAPTNATAQTTAPSAPHSPDLFQLRLDKAVPDAGGYVFQDVAAEFAIDLDGDLLATNPNFLSFSLPDGTRFEVARKHLMHESKSVFTWYGEVLIEAGTATRATRQAVTHAGTLAPGYAMLTWIEGRVLGVLQTPEAEHYHVAPGADGSHRLLLAAPSKGHSCALGQAVDSATRLQASTLPGSSMAGWGLTPSTLSLAPTSPATQSLDKSTCTPPRQIHRIDVLGVYVEALEADLQATEDFFVSALAQANTVYQNSEVSLRFNLIDTTVLNESPGGDVIDAIDWMFDEPQVLRDLRNQHGADIVALMMPINSDSYCGAAVLPIRKIINSVTSIVTYRDTDTDFNDQAYVTFERGCGVFDYTLAHEIGHTFGMQHSREDGEATTDEGVLRPLKPYAYGYLFNGPYEPPYVVFPQNKGATLMGCDDEGNYGLGTCHRAPYLSNPYLYNKPNDPDPEPLGEPLTATNGGSFNACVANQRASLYAGFRNFDGNSVPSVQITAPNSGAVVTSLPFTLSATATDAEDGDLSAQVLWTSSTETLKRAGTNNPAIGSSVPINFEVPGQHMITARVTDSGGKFHERVITLQVNEAMPRLWVDNPTHLQQVSGSMPVVGWALDDKTGEQLSFKVDNQPVTVSNFQRGPREDACFGNPDMKDPDCSFGTDKLVGFSGFLDTTTLSNGNHTLKATVTDSAGNQKTFQRTFKVLNPETFTVVADAWTNQQYPNNNYGSSTALYARNFNSGQARYTYLKFNLGLDQTPSSVKLRLRTLGQWVTQARIYRLATTNWNEYGITWNNGPLDSLGSLALPSLPPNSLVEIDITSLVSASGLYTFGLLAADLPGIGFYSRETNFKPEIVVTY